MPVRGFPRTLHPRHGPTSRLRPRIEIAIDLERNPFALGVPLPLAVRRVRDGVWNGERQAPPLSEHSGGGLHRRARVGHIVKGHARGDEIKPARPPMSGDAGGIHHTVLDSEGARCLVPTGDLNQFVRYVDGYDVSSLRRELAGEVSLAAPDVKHPQAFHAAASSEQRGAMNLEAIEVEPALDEVLPRLRALVPGSPNLLPADGTPSGHDPDSSVASRLKPFDEEGRQNRRGNNLKREDANPQDVPRVIFYVDMDAFYARVERGQNPDLIGKPVCGRAAQRA